MSKIVFLVIILYIIDTYKADNHLRSVIVLYRHGDRTPTKIYPRDPYQNVSIYWPDGLGELTNLGLQRQYKLGQWLRDRYNHFLPEKYSPDDIYVWSTDKDRTLMSAAANLAGLYPPRNKQIWNKDLLWRPIPIHTVSEEEDAVLAMKKPCPKYDMLYAELLESPFFNKTNEKNRELYKFLSRHTGWKIKSLREIETLYSLLLIELEYNYTLPHWTEMFFPEKLQNLAALSHATFSFTPQLARLKNGPFFDYLFSHLDSIVNKNSSTKFLMLSAHDNTIVNILSTLSLYDYSCPDFASALILELWQNKKYYYVNLYFKNKATLKPLKLLECGVNCKYTEFKSFLKYFTLDLESWTKECLV